MAFKVGDEVTDKFYVYTVEGMDEEAEPGLAAECGLDMNRYTLVRPNGERHSDVPGYLLRKVKI